ncbi:MAG: hypothetical protein FJZ00_14195, partial [Candidatus Sericytochromatia bacterium]|nr:hypothetical protein [Candidatus Tanganyikabacteria bacterium]
MNELLDLIATDLETKGPDANGWHTARCPFHDDRHPSLRIAAHGFICMGCGEKGNLEKLAGRLGMASAESPRGGLKVAELARAKGVPEAFLRSLGVADGWAGSGSDRVSCVDIPYLDEDGNVTAVRKRLSLCGSKRFVWRRGDHPSLYGLWLLPNVRKAGKVMLVEGESDCWALWHARVHALGVPGASTWKQQYRSVVDGLEVYVWHEPDSGGDGLVRAAANDIPSLRIIEPPAGIKDPSELYLKDPEGFHEQIRVLIATAKRFADVRAEALSTEARKAFEVAQQLLDDPHLLRRLYSVLAESGFAGDPRPASLAYIAITSRLVPRPMNVAYIAPSGAGKNAAIDAVLPLFPPEAVYVVRASSPRALVFNDALFTHRTVVVTEADSLPEEGPAASAIRSLMSDGEMAYEIVEKGEDGRHITRR